MNNMYFTFKNIFLLCILIMCSTSFANSQNAKGVFGTAEYKSSEIDAFKKWGRLRTRHAGEAGKRKSNFKSIMEKPCRLSRNFKCVSDEWIETINSLKNKKPKAKIDGVNQYLNKAPYVTDMVNWQQKDYWATLNQFFNKDGDCEDYAIAKYYSLKELGFSPDQMRIVVVRDNNLNIAHAVLAVYLENKIWILDNQISQVLEDNHIVHYTPLYSINEKAWWLHKKL